MSVSFDIYVEATFNSYHNLTFINLLTFPFVALMHQGVSSTKALNILFAICCFSVEVLLWDSSFCVLRVTSQIF